MAIDAAQLQQIMEAALQANAEQQAQAIQAAVAALQQQAAPPPPHGGGLQHPQAVAFAEVPGDAGDQPWDFTPGGDGVKLFKDATKPLEEKFDGKQQSLNHFLNAVSRRGGAYGWSNVLTVLDDDGMPQSLTHEYGTLNVGNITVHARAYQMQLTQTRQAATCLRIFIEGSVNAELSDRLNQHKSDFTIMVNDPMNPPLNQGDPHPQRQAIDGAMMLFKLIKLVSIETRSTITNICKQLNNLPVIMEKCESDIEKFNIKVNELLTELRARDVSVPDIVTNLFEAYRAAGDSAFVTYFARKEDEFEDGTIATLTETQLMTMAHEKYKTLSNRQEWMKKSDHELEFIAMKAYFVASSANNKKKLTQVKNNNRLSTYGGASSQSAMTTTGPPSSGNNKRNTGKFAWKAIAPKPGEPTKKVWNDKAYIHCPHHGDTKWVLETSNRGRHVENCQAMMKAQGAQGTVAMTAKCSAPTSTGHGARPFADEMKLARAMAHVMQVGDDPFADEEE